MHGEHNCKRLLASKSPDETKNRSLMFQVKMRCGLIKQQDLRLLSQGTCNHNTLLLPTGQFAYAT